MGYNSNRLSKREREFLSITPGSPTGVNVVEGNISYALQQWKRKVKDSGIMREVYERKEFLKPSVKRRKVILDAIFRYKKLHGHE